MKKQNRRTNQTENKLELKRTIIRQLAEVELGRVGGGTWIEIPDRPSCTHPAYSA